MGSIGRQKIHFRFEIGCRVSTSFLRMTRRCEQLNTSGINIREAYLLAHWYRSIWIRCGDARTKESNAEEIIAKRDDQDCADEKLFSGGRRREREVEIIFRSLERHRNVCGKQRRELTRERELKCWVLLLGLEGQLGISSRARVQGTEIGF
jgi:hypothetical protein